MTASIAQMLAAVVFLSEPALLLRGNGCLFSDRLLLCQVMASINLLSLLSGGRIDLLNSREIKAMHGRAANYAVLMAYTVGVYVLLIIGDNAHGLISRLLSPAERAAGGQPGPLERVRVLSRLAVLAFPHPTKPLTSRGRLCAGV